MKTLGQLLLLVIACSISTARADENYLCTFGQQQREISLIYQYPEAPLPCEVRYKKAGKTEIMWSAENTQGFCERKLQSFVQQQIDWGWRCSNLSATANIISQVDQTNFLQEVAFSQAILLMAPFKSHIAQYQMEMGDYPTDLRSIGMDPDAMKDSSHISDLALGEAGTIYVKGSGGLGEGTIISLTPQSTLGGMAMEWRCVTNIVLARITYCEYQAELTYPE